MIFNKESHWQIQKSNIIRLVITNKIFGITNIDVNKKEHTNKNEKERKVELSVKKLEEQQTKEVLKKYGKVDSGSQLADILGPALKAEKKPKKTKKDKKEE